MAKKLQGLPTSGPSGPNMSKRFIKGVESAGVNKGSRGDRSGATNSGVGRSPGTGASKGSSSMPKGRKNDDD